MKINLSTDVTAQAVPQCFRALIVASALAITACSPEGTGEFSQDNPTNAGSGSTNTTTDNETNNPGTNPGSEAVADPGNSATTATSHARVQQQFLSNPAINGAIATGQSFDFSATDTIALRELLSNTMVVYQGKLDTGDGLSFIDFTFHHIYCPGGKFVFFKTVSDGAFNIGLPSELNPVLTGDETTERRDGVWDAAVVSGVDDDGVGFVVLNILNMFDFAEAFRQSGQIIDFPAPGQNDIPAGEFLITPEGQVLAPDPVFWVPVQAANQQGVFVVGQQQISPRVAAPDICG